MTKTILHLSPEKQAMRDKLIRSYTKRNFGLSTREVATALWNYGLEGSIDGIQTLVRKARKSFQWG